MTDKNPFWDKLTKAIRDSEIDNELKQLSMQETFFKDSAFNFAERLSISFNIFKTFPAWVSDYFSGIDMFKEKYITNGNTDALNMVMLNRKYKKIFTLPNEYMYYTHMASSLGIKQQYFTPECFELIDREGIVCLSVPAAYDGEIEERQQIIDYCQANDIPIFIDVAYCGITQPGKINIRPTNNTFFAFSFSKTMGLAFNRVGLLYANESVASASIMNKIGYVNLSGAQAALHLMRKFPCDYIYQTYKDQYEALCVEHGILPTKCILFGRKENSEKLCISEFYKLK